MTSPSIPPERRILYLEDEIIIALDTAETLRDMGFAEVGVANTLRKARALAAEGDFHMALLDVNLGGREHSLDFGRGLIAAGMPVIFATGYNRVEMEAEHSDLVFVEKPLNAEAIAAALARVGAL